MYINKHTEFSGLIMIHTNTIISVNTHSQTRNMKVIPFKNATPRTKLKIEKKKSSYILILHRTKGIKCHTSHVV